MSGIQKRLLGSGPQSWLHLGSFEKSQRSDPTQDTRHQNLWERDPGIRVLYSSPDDSKGAVKDGEQLSPEVKWNQWNTGAASRDQYRGNASWELCERPLSRMSSTSTRLLSWMAAGQRWVTSPRRGGRRQLSVLQSSKPGKLRKQPQLISFHEQDHWQGRGKRRIKDWMKIFQDRTQKKHDSLRIQYLKKPQHILYYCCIIWTA